MAFLDSQDSFFSQLMNFKPHSFAQNFMDTEAEGEHSLVDNPEFGPNPGNLRMLSHLPTGMERGAPLVVVLHGCKQNAAVYDRGAGWSELANRFGFAVLLPEQRHANNGQGCFNWFQTEDVTRGDGEVASIAAMIRFMLHEYRLDDTRVFITGLSAGGGMTAAMLAAYPELFAGGSIIAGLPYGSASSVQEAFGVMGQGRVRKPVELGARVRAASPHTGPWPRIAIWQGEADHVVNPINAMELAKQWTDVHGLPQAPTAETMIGAVRHTEWRHAGGKPAVEIYTVPGFGHATPIDPAATLEDARCGSATASRYILPAGISSTYVMAESWGLTRHPRPRVRPAAGQRKPAAATHPLWQNLLPGGATSLKDITAELAAPDSLVGRILRSTGVINDGKRK